MGWLLCSQLTTARPLEASVNLATTHALKFDMALQDETVSDKINEFLNLDSIGICDKELSVYEKCINKIEFINKFKISI